MKRPPGDMFYGAKKNIFLHAIELRKNMTRQELKLWEYLSASKINKFRFKSQHPIGIYIADFYCHRAKLVIEIDGGYHKQDDQTKYDRYRDDTMTEWGIKIIRFTNEDVENEIEKVLEKINLQLSEICS